MAAPHVTGAVALVASVRQDLMANQLKTLLTRSANGNVNPKAPGVLRGRDLRPQKVPDKTLSKYGLLDVSAALNAESSISVPVTALEVLPTSSTLRAGNTLQLYAVLTPEDATDIGVAWSSDAPAVAAVDTSTGLVTARAEGKATITANASGGDNISKSVIITVSLVDPNPNDPASPTYPSGGGGGGCDTGIGAFIPFILVLVGVGAWWALRPGDWGCAETTAPGSGPRGSARWRNSQIF
jgi:hypothetical protein